MPILDIYLIYLLDWDRVATSCGSGLDVAWTACSQSERAYQLTSEHAARVQVDVEVARVVWHSQLFGDSAHTAVDVEARPRGIGLLLNASQARVALGKAEVEHVADSDR